MMVAITLALVDLSTCRVIVHHETYALLRHSVEELRLVERRSHYHGASVFVVKQCPSFLYNVLHTVNTQQYISTVI